MCTGGRARVRACLCGCARACVRVCVCCQSFKFQPVLCTDFHSSRNTNSSNSSSTCSSFLNCFTSFTSSSPSPPPPPPSPPSSNFTPFCELSPHFLCHILRLFSFNQLFLKVSSPLLARARSVDFTSHYRQIATPRRRREQAEVHDILISLVFFCKGIRG